MTSAKSAKQEKFKIVEVEWVDSEQNASWEKLEDVLDEQKGSLNCKSVGYVVSDRDDRVILASSMTASEEYEEQVSHYMVIPRQAILSIKEIKVLRPNKKKTKIDIQEQP